MNTRRPVFQNAATRRALAHQFDDLGQQYEASTIGMWAFLLTEIMFFGGLFLAAGFLLGMARGQEFEMSLRAGCLAASEVISHIGARPVRDLQQLADEHRISLLAPA